MIQTFKSQIYSLNRFRGVTGVNFWVRESRLDRYVSGSQLKKFELCLSVLGSGLENLLYPWRYQLQCCLLHLTKIHSHMLQCGQWNTVRWLYHLQRLLHQHWKNKMHTQEIKSTSIQCPPLPVGGVSPMKSQRCVNLSPLYISSWNRMNKYICWKRKVE